jgi:hypothetical protein
MLEERGAFERETRFGLVWFAWFGLVWVRFRFGSVSRTSYTKQRDQRAESREQRAESNREHREERAESR